MNDKIWFQRLCMLSIERFLPVRCVSISDATFRGAPRACRRHGKHPVGGSWGKSILCRIRRTATGNRVQESGGLCFGVWDLPSRYPSRPRCFVMCVHITLFSVSSCCYWSEIMFLRYDDIHVIKPQKYPSTTAQPVAGPPAVPSRLSPRSPWA